MEPELLVRHGAEDRLQNVPFEDWPVFPTPGCTTVTVYPHETRQPSLTRRLLAPVTF